MAKSSEIYHGALQTRQGEQPTLGIRQKAAEIIRVPIDVIIAYKERRAITRGELRKKREEQQLDTLYTQIYFSKATKDVPLVVTPEEMRHAVEDSLDVRSERIKQDKLNSNT